MQSCVLMRNSKPDSGPTSRLLQLLLKLLARRWNSNDTVADFSPISYSFVLVVVVRLQRRLSSQDQTVDREVQPIGNDPSHRQPSPLLAAVQPL